MTPCARGAFLAMFVIYTSIHRRVVTELFYNRSRSPEISEPQAPWVCTIYSLPYMSFEKLRKIAWVREVSESWYRELFNRYVEVLKRSILTMRAIAND